MVMKTLLTAHAVFVSESPETKSRMFGTLLLFRVYDSSLLQ